MPINKVYSIKEVFKSVDAYVKKTNRRVTIEYILIKDLNDSVKEAKELADLLRGRLTYVNLIPYNAVKRIDYKKK